MRPTRTINRLMIILLFGLPQLGLSSGIVSPFNNLGIESDSISSTYSFMIGGHFHGSSNNSSTLPAATLLANIELVNNSDAKLIISLGDLFMDTETNVEKYDHFLFSRLEMPLLNAPGNHDVGDYYEDKYGPTFFSFSVKSELFIILNTELSNGSIEGNQMDWFADQLTRAKSDKECENIFIFSHRPVWTSLERSLESAFKNNTSSVTGNNFVKDVWPMVTQLAKSVDKDVYWFSGSLGGGAPASFFYHEIGGVHLIQTAIRDLPRDGVLQVNCIQGKVLFQTISLTGQQLHELEYYDLAFWQNKSSSKATFNFKLIPLYIEQMFTHRYFWYGIGWGALLMLGWGLLRNAKRAV